jgi:hypothetical protein
MLSWHVSLGEQLQQKENKLYNGSGNTVHTMFFMKIKGEMK